MANDLLVVASSPHIRSKDSVEKIMYSVALALTPAALVGVYVFGWHALSVLLISIGAAIATEVLWLRLRGKPLRVSDGSALVTGLLLGMNLPPSAPLWMAALGSVVAIIIGKQVYGGLGANPFNPALVGRVFLTASFPALMTKWSVPTSYIDAYGSATPLANALSAEIPLRQLLLGNIPGCIGEVSAIALLIGGLYLLMKSYIDYRIVGGIFGSVIVLSLVMGLDPLFQVLTGGLMLGAFFMATDYVTSPVTPIGRWIFGIGIGILVMLIRQGAGMPEGVSFSILLMNAAVPLINRATRPRIYGRYK
ncbi:MAG: RnfABCDGE type electron transport complex subunit D [Bacillota bacterium]